MLSLIKNQEKSRARGMGEAMSFDEQEDPLSDCMEHAEKMAKEIETLRVTIAEGVDNLRNMLTFTSRAGYSQTYQDQKNKAIEFVRSHTPKPDEPIPPSKEWSDG